MRRKTIGTVLLAGALVAGGTIAAMLPASAEGPEARATLRDPSGAALGTVRLATESGGKVSVRLAAGGLSPGFHGFHIHGIGICDGGTAFASAGGHLNPGGASHPAHAGDQPVLLVNADGTTVARFETDRYSIADLFDANGSAFIVHALPDNYANVARYGTPDATTLATGDAGARVACGAITG
jgi:Cu-Zn family superoxide dismutase